MKRSLAPVLLLTVTGLVCCGSGSSSSALVDSGTAPPSLTSWFSSPPTPAKPSKHKAQRKKKGQQNVRPEDDEWVQSLEKVCDRALLSQVRVKWRQVFGALSSSAQSLTHPLGRASSAVGQRLHALMHFCRAAVPGLSATLAPRAPLLAGVLWGLDQADRVLYKEEDDSITPPPTLQELPAKLLHNGAYAMQSHAELGSLLVATATRLVKGLANAAHSFSQKAASLLWSQVKERWESLGVHGLGQRLMGHWRRLGLLRRWVALVEKLLQRLHAAARFLSSTTPALLNGQAQAAAAVNETDTCSSGPEGKEWAVRGDTGASKPFPSRRWFHPPGLPTETDPEEAKDKEAPLKPAAAKKRVPPSVYSPLRGRVVTVNVRYKFHVNGSAPSSPSSSSSSSPSPPLTTTTTTTTTTTIPLDMDSTPTASTPTPPPSSSSSSVNASVAGSGGQGEERRGMGRWLLGRGGHNPTTHKPNDWGHKVRRLLGLEKKKGVEEKGDETLRAAFGLLGRLAGHFPEAQDVEVLITAAQPTDTTPTKDKDSGGKGGKPAGQQRARPSVWRLLLRGLGVGLLVSLVLLSVAVLDKQGAVEHYGANLLQDVGHWGRDLWAHPRVQGAVEGACSGGVVVLLWVQGGRGRLSREELAQAASTAAQSLAHSLRGVAHSGATAVRGAWAARPWKEAQVGPVTGGDKAPTTAVQEGRAGERDVMIVGAEGEGLEDDEGFEVIAEDAEHDASFVLVEQLPIGEDRGNHPLQ